MAPFCRPYSFIPTPRAVGRGISNSATGWNADPQLVPALGDPSTLVGMTLGSGLVSG